MDTRSLLARLSFVVLIAASAALGVGEARAAAIGAQLGVDRSGVDGDVPPNTEYVDQFGLVAGVQGEIGLAHGLSLSLQPSFVQKKTSVRLIPENGGEPTNARDLSFDYISIPAVVKFAMAGGRTYVSGGVSVDFLTTAKLSGGGSDHDVTGAYNGTELGAVLGLGVVFPAGRTRFTTELRLVQGLTNMQTGAVSEATGALAPRLHSHGLELVVGSLFPVGGR